MKIHEIVYTLDTINNVAEDFADLASLVSVFTFAGELGAGKTTLIRAMLQKWGVQDEIVHSPTFTYLNIYTNAQGVTFYHFDLYRIKSLHDFLLAGFQEYLYQPNSLALIEWPEIIMPLLKQRACHCTLDYHGDDRRRARYIIV